MKTNIRNLGILAVVLAIVSFMWISTPMAAESMLTGNIESSTTAISKAQKEYVRLIVNTDKQLNGVKYQTQAVVMAFEPEIVAKAKQYKKGDAFSAVCSSKEYNGRTSYQILKLSGMKPIAASTK